MMFWANVFFAVVNTYVMFAWCRFNTINFYLNAVASALNIWLVIRALS